MHATRVGRSAPRVGLAIHVREDGDEAAVARIEVEVTLGRVVQVRLLEHEGHAEQALPEVDRRLPVGTDERDVMDALALELPHGLDLGLVFDGIRAGHATRYTGLGISASPRSSRSTPPMPQCWCPSTTSDGTPVTPASAAAARMAPSWAIRTGLWAAATASSGSRPALRAARAICASLETSSPSQKNASYRAPLNRRSCPSSEAHKQAASG